MMRKLLMRVEKDRMEVLKYLTTDKIHSAKLTKLFHSLCINSSNTFSPSLDKLKVFRFEIFVEEFYLFNSNFNKSHLRKLLRRYNLLSSDDLKEMDVRYENEAKSLISKKVFFDLIIDIAIRRRNMKKNVKSIRKLLLSIYNHKKFDLYTNNLPMFNWNECRKMEIVFWRYEAVLKKIYSHYSNETKKNKKKKQIMKKKIQKKQNSKQNNTRGTKKNTNRNTQKKEANTTRTKNNNSKVTTTESMTQKMDFDKENLGYNEIIKFCSEFGLLKTDVSVTTFEISKLYSTLFGARGSSEKRETNSVSSMYGFSPGSGNKGNEIQMLINYEKFLNLLTRIAIFKYNRVSLLETYGWTNDAIVVLFLEKLKVGFGKVFLDEMEKYVEDLITIPPPVISNVIPREFDFNGGRVEIEGKKFDVRKGGMFMKIQCDDMDQVMKYNSYQRKEKNEKKFMNGGRDIEKVSFIVPPVRFDDVRKIVKLKIQIVEREKMKFGVNIHHYINKSISVTNDLHEGEYSNKLEVKYLEKMPEFEVGHEISYGLLKVFSSTKILGTLDNGEKEKEKNVGFMWEKMKNFLKRELKNFNYSERKLYDNLDLGEYEKGENTFTSFLAHLICFSLNEIIGLHPLDYLISIIQYNLKLDYLCDLSRVYTPNEIYIRHRREYDIYKGPLRLGRILELKDNRFEYKSFSKLYEKTINFVIEFSENFDHFLTRLTSGGFLCAASTSQVRSPLGRCWKIFRKKKRKQNYLLLMEDQLELKENMNWNMWTDEDIRYPIAAVWDYRGDFSCLWWNPETKEVEKQYTCCVYNEHDVRFLFETYQEKDSSKDFIEEIQNSDEYITKLSMI